MIFSKQDRDNLAAVKTLLVQHVKATAEGQQRVPELIKLLNELGVAVGRVEQKVDTLELSLRHIISDQFAGQDLRFNNIQGRLDAMEAILVELKAPSEVWCAGFEDGFKEGKQAAPQSREPRKKRKKGK